MADKLPQVKTPNDLAAVLNLSPKSVRDVLRKVLVEKPGSGGQYDLSNISTEEWIAIFRDRKGRKTVVAELK